jgi:hypothetical protein
MSLTEHLPAASSDALVIAEKDQPALVDQVIQLKVPEPIQEQLAQRLKLCSATFQAPYSSATLEIAAKSKVVTTLAGVTSLSADISGPAFAVPIKWQYHITFRTTTDEPIEGGRRIAGVLDLHSSRGDYSIHFDVRVVIGLNDQNMLEPKSAEVVWIGPDLLK